MLAIGNQLEQLRQKRNLVAHQFVGASTEGGEAYVLCAAGSGGPAGDTTRITQTELTMLIRQMDECAHRIRSVKALVS